MDASSKSLELTLEVQSLVRKILSQKQSPEANPPADKTHTEPSSILRGA
jgi:hypothetical protein